MGGGFIFEMSMFDKRQLAECTHRELTKRRENYPRWVRDRKMTQKIADEQISMMETVHRMIMRAPDSLIQEVQE